MPDPIVFKCEPRLWEMMNEEGVTGIPYKPFDMRRRRERLANLPIPGK